MVGDEPVKKVEIEPGVAQDIQAAIQDMIRQYKNEFGKEPFGILFGPVEYLVIKDLFKGDLKTLMGYQIRVKASPGVELIVHAEDAFKLAWEQLGEGKH